MKLYNFFRSSSSHRLRIALGLKGLAHNYVPVDLRAERHLLRALNPQAMVPALEHQGTVLIGRHRVVGRAPPGTIAVASQSILEDRARVHWRPSSDATFSRSTTGVFSNTA